MPGPLQWRRLMNGALAVEEDGGLPPGPLDAHTTGLHGAWSAGRRLLGSHAGPLLRVRRSTDDAELDIGWDAEGVLDAAVLVAFCEGDAGFVTRVYDQTGAGWDLVQPVAHRQPQVVRAGELLVTSAGRAVMEGETATSHVRGLVVTRTPSVEAEMVVAGFGVTGADNYGALGDLAPNSFSQQQFGIWEGFTPGVYYGYRGSGAGGVAGIGSGAEAAWAVRFDGTQRRCRVNGTWGAPVAGSSVDFTRVRLLGLQDDYLTTWQAAAELAVWRAEALTEAAVEEIEAGMRGFYVAG